MGQDLNAPVTFSLKEAPLPTLFTLLEEQTGVIFFYNNNLIDQQPPVTLEVNNQPVKAVLDQALVHTNVVYKVVAGQLVLRGREEVKGEAGWEKPYLNRKNYTISGRMWDEGSGEGLVGATVFIRSLGVGTTANAYGFYSLTVPEGNYTLEASLLGFLPFSTAIKLDSDHKVDLQMEPFAAQLKEVVIAGEKLETLRDFEQNMSKLPIQQYTAVPALLGRRDILEGVQMQPGILRKTEGTTGFHVRGGNADQNLILIDEAPVYNEAHFLGFLSVFNWNTLKSAEFYRSGIPARYGGRLSSVLDLRMKEGNMNHFAGSGEMNTMYGQLTLEGPIVKDRLSGLVSARRSYADFFLDAEIEDQFNIRDFAFYDVNAKFNLRLGEKDHLYLSGYLGRDRFINDREFFDYQTWGNTTGTLRWNHVFNKKLFSNLSVIYSDYNFYQSQEFEDSDYFFGMGIDDLTAKWDFNYYPAPRHKVRFGASLTDHEFVPGEAEEGSDTAFVVLNLVPPQTALEWGFYASDEWTLTERWQLQAGLRYSLFQNYGDAVINVLDEDGVEERQLINEDGVYNTEGGFEPRVKLSYELTPKHLLAFSYDHTRQYLHLATNTINKAPTDVWFPTTNNVKPQVADQLALSWFSLWKERTYQIQTAVYIKWGRNAIDFRERANLVLNEDLEAEIKQGDLLAYGWETQILKQKGKLTGAINYTLSQAQLEIVGINQGVQYPANYDRPHELNVWARYQLKPRWLLSANFVLSSGLPVNFPVGTYTLQDEVFVAFGPKNSDRLPTYHRADVGVTFLPKETTRWQGEWSFSIYNVYNRYNAYSLVFTGENAGNNEATLRYIFPFLPSLSYRFSF